MRVLFNSLIVTLWVLGGVGCLSPKSEQRSKWKPYTLRMEDEARAEREKVGLKGRTAYTPVDSLGTLKLVGVDSFDSKGFLVLSKTYQADGKALKETRHDYANGLLMHSSQLDARGVIHIYCQYDSTGNKLFEYVLRTPVDTMLTRRYRYDARGRETEGFFWRMENDLKARKETVYDDSDRPVKVIEYEGDAVNWKEEYTYQGEAKLTAERFDAMGALQKRFEMDFDSSGHCLRMEQYNGIGDSKVKVMYTYGPDGKLMREDTYAGKDLNEYTTYAYDSRGMLASRKVFAYGVTTEIRYENRYRN
jgi:hypothetical protein